MRNKISDNIIHENSKIYIAGHSGLVGSAIMRRLQQLCVKNIIVKNHNELDLTRQSEVESFFEEERPDFVFLAAARVGGILANNTYKAEFIYQNIMIAANIIHASYKYGVKKLLNFGSSCIYPKFAPQPMAEECLLTGNLEPTNEPYAIAKISAIKLCRYYNEQYGTNFISVMPTNLYGLNDNFHLESSHVLPALIRKIHLGKCLYNSDFKAIKEDLKKFPLHNINVELLKDSDIINLLSEYGIKTISSSKFKFSTVVELWGSGTPFREFLYVDDLAGICVLLMQKYDVKDVGEFVNIGTGIDVQIKNLADLIKEIVGYKGQIRWNASKPDGTPKKLLDISKIKAFGWEPKTSLEDGIRKVYTWYLNRCDKKSSI
ncbi:MAG: GDP-L-fucose synthase [Candidatus Brocadia sapporoensis]|nr:MAG: GDP-L-fucose synthase [Candidatus Brocadia sapporoensis]